MCQHQHWPRIKLHVLRMLQSFCFPAQARIKLCHWVLSSGDVLCGHHTAIIAMLRTLGLLSDRLQQTQMSMHALSEHVSGRRFL